MPKPLSLAAVNAAKAAAAQASVEASGEAAVLPAPAAVPAVPAAEGSISVHAPAVSLHHHVARMHSVLLTPQSSGSAKMVTVHDAGLVPALNRALALLAVDLPNLHLCWAGPAAAVPVVVSPATLKDSSAAAPAALATAVAVEPDRAADASTQGADTGGRASQQQQQEQPQSRPAVAPGAGALVPRLSPVYHIGSLPTLFESPHSSEEVRHFVHARIFVRLGSGGAATVRSAASLPVNC